VVEEVFGLVHVAQSVPVVGAGAQENPLGLPEKATFINQLQNRLSEISSDQLATMQVADVRANFEVTIDAPHSIRVLFLNMDSYRN